MCDPNKNITIDKFTGDESGKELLNCYFQYVTERDEFFIYKFFDQDGNEIIGDLRVGRRFNFELKGKSWSLNITASSCEIVSGQWTDSDNWEPDQSYQAQAGGTVADDANAAAATA